MRKYTPESLKKQIAESTEHLIAEGGMTNFSFPKLTAATGISAPTVYELYENKEELLTSCFLDIDAEIGSLLADVMKKLPKSREPADLESSCWLLWVSYWRYLTADADRTRFYWAFYNSPYYSLSVVEKRAKNYTAFIGYVNVIDEKCHVSDRCCRRVLIMNMIDSTISSAIKVFRGTYGNDDTTVRTIYSSVFQPIFAVLNSGD